MPVAVAKKPERLVSVLDRLGNELGQSEKLSKLLSISAVMGIALVLSDKEFRYEKGLTHAYLRRLHKMVPTLFSILRASRSTLATEFMSLLRKGPTLYYAEATTRLQKLQVEEK